MKILKHLFKVQDSAKFWIENKRKDREIAAWKKKYAELAQQVKKSRGAGR